MDERREIKKFREEVELAESSKLEGGSEPISGEKNFVSDRGKQITMNRNRFAKLWSKVKKINRSE